MFQRTLFTLEIKYPIYFLLILLIINFYLL